jgi:hypothetical protein
MGRTSAARPDVSHDRLLVALLYAAAALPFHIAYGSLVSGVVAVTVAAVLAVALAVALRASPLWLYALVLAVVALPLAYLTGIGPLVVALLAAALGTVQRMRASER